VQKFALVCNNGHAEEFRKEVEAGTVEEAVEMLMEDTEVMAHVSSAHPEMAGKAPEEMRDTVLAMVRPVENGEEGPLPADSEQAS
jgi:hypothetical protein